MAAPRLLDVTEPIELSRRDARRIAVRAQLLTSERPSDLLALARHLTVLQYDVTRHVAPSADLVAWSRLGAEFRPGDLEAAVAAGSLVELDMMLRPAEDIALFTAEMAAWPGPGELKDWQVETRDWLSANDHCRRDILDKLFDEGPLPAGAFPDTTVVPWESSGWNNDRNVRMLVGLLVSKGEVAAAGREGRERLYDLAERVYPDVPPVPLEEALAIRRERRLRALGIARARAALTPGEPNHVGETGVEAVVEGLRGTWRVDPAYLDASTTPSTAGPRSSPPSTVWSWTASARRRSSGSTTSWRCTSRPPSGAGATGRCRSSTTTSWWESSMPPPIATAACSASTPSTRTATGRGGCATPSIARSRPWPPGWGWSRSVEPRNPTRAPTTRRDASLHTDPVDLSTFYAVVSATCFTLVGLWWTVVERRPEWLADTQLRRLVGGVYVSFLLPALMSLFAQIDPSEPLIWRITFVAASAIGAWSTFRLIQVDRQVDFPGPVRRFRWLVGVVYGLIALLGVVPEIAVEIGMTPPQAAAFLLVLLVVLAHALTWEFMTENRPAESARE